MSTWVNIDQSIGDNDHLAVTYFFVKTTQNAFGGGPIPWDINQSYTDQTNANISEVHTFSPSTANQAWLTFTRAAGGRVNLPATDLGKLGSDFTIQGPSGLPQLNVSGYFNVGGALAGPVTTSDFYSFRDMVTMTKGKHTLIYGGEVALDKGMFAGNLYNFGVFTFQSSAPTSTGNALADFVTGQVNTMEQDTPYHTLMSAWHTALFVQDNYRITPRFTANLGLRWDIDTPPVESSNLTAAFVPGQQSTVVPSAPLGMLFPGDKGSCTRHCRHTLASRFAAHWLCMGSVGRRKNCGSRRSRHLLRHNQRQRMESAGQRATVCHPPDFQLHHISDTSVQQPGSFPTGDPFPYIYNPSSPRFLKPASIESIGPNVQWPYMYQLNFAIQRQLPGQL